MDDLSDWRYEGVIYRKKQDPLNKSGLRCLYAPDVAKGPDGRFYLYYAIDFMGVMSVAVCDTPAGEYQFLGHLRFPDGHVWGSRSGEPFPFDPGILVDDDGKVYLYSGFATKVPFVATRFRNLTNEGGVVLELEPDMVTIRTAPKLLFPTKGHAQSTGFEGHEFFEASSMRKINGKYFFIYSSALNHELCYAVSDIPVGGFTYGGTLVDIGDVGLNEREENNAVNYLGNTHGSIVNIRGSWYVFYHRQTNRHSYSRQACAEKLIATESGGFKQAEITSCGLNGGPLEGQGRYEVRIACNLWSKNGTGRYDVRMAKRRFAAHPYFTQSGGDREDQPDQYIANMRDGSVAGFKYFRFGGLKQISIEVSGNGSGMMQVSLSPDFHEMAAEIAAVPGGKAVTFTGDCRIPDGIWPLYFRFIGNKSLDFLGFTLLV